jgi:hypothetical protein
MTRVEKQEKLKEKEQMENTEGSNSRSCDVQEMQSCYFAWVLPAHSILANLVYVCVAPPRGSANAAPLNDVVQLSCIAVLFPEDQ